jgi:phage shock protein A
MASIEARVKRLEKKAAKLETDLKKAKAALKESKVNHNKLKARVAALEKEQKDIIKWIKMQVAWSKEVTLMLRMIDWNALAAAYPGGGGTNPPATPPDWPIS